MSNLDPLKAIGLQTLLLALALIGLFIVAGLVWAWARYRRRQREIEARWRHERERHAEVPSAWEESGRRYRGETDDPDEDETKPR